MAINLWCRFCAFMHSDSDDSGGGCAEVAADSSQIGYPFFVFIKIKIVPFPIAFSCFMQPRRCTRTIGSEQEKNSTSFQFHPSSSYFVTRHLPFCVQADRIFFYFNLFLINILIITAQKNFTRDSLFSRVSPAGATAPLLSRHMRWHDKGRHGGTHS